MSSSVPGRAVKVQTSEQWAAMVNKRQAADAEEAWSRALDARRDGLHWREVERLTRKAISESQSVYFPDDRLEVRYHMPWRLSE